MCNEREKFSLTAAWGNKGGLSITDLSRLLPDSNMQAVMRVWAGLTAAGYELGETSLPAHIVDEKAVEILQTNLPFYRRSAILCLYDQLRDRGLSERKGNWRDSIPLGLVSEKAAAIDVAVPLVN